MGYFCSNEVFSSFCFSFSRYVDPDDSVMDPTSILSKDSNWIDKHVRQSQYVLQILKCQDTNCCKPRRSSLFKFLPETGLPAPLPLNQSIEGLKISDVKGADSFVSLFISLALRDTVESENFEHNIPYDTFCPSVKSKLNDRTCVCGRYYSSIAAMKRHLKNSGCKKSVKNIKPKSVLGQREEEKLALVAYDDEEDVEWVYDMDVDLDTVVVFEEPDKTENMLFPIQTVLNPIWEDC